MSKVLVRRVFAPGDCEAIYADDYDEPGTKCGYIDGVVGYDADRNIWLVYTDKNMLIEITASPRSDNSWDYLNKMWEPVKDSKPTDSGYWVGAPEAIGKWLRGEIGPKHG